MPEQDGDKHVVMKTIKAGGEEESANTGLRLFAPRPCPEGAGKVGSPPQTADDVLHPVFAN